MDERYVIVGNGVLAPGGIMAYIILVQILVVHQTQNTFGGQAQPNLVVGVLQEFGENRLSFFQIRNQIRKRLKSLFNRVKIVVVSVVGFKPDEALVVFPNEIGRASCRERV